jgi:hypothetical protein
MENKNCSKKDCSQINPQPLSNFHVSKRKKDGLQIWCKTCNKEVRKEYRLKNIDLLRQKDRELKRKNGPIYNFNRNKKRKENPLLYRETGWKQKGIKNKVGDIFNRNDFKELFLKQGGRCSICKSSKEEKGLVPDHSHKTGFIRGLLCFSCNTGIGQLGDSVDFLKLAIAYLQENEPNV